MKGSEALIQFLPLIIIFVLFYFLMIKPQKKREKQTQDMRNSVQPGDEIVTIGGICGKIVKTKDETVTIQVGADKVRFEIMRWAISKVEKSSASRKPVETEEEAPKKSLPKRLKKAESEAPEAAEAAATESKEALAKALGEEE